MKKTTKSAAPGKKFWICGALLGICLLCLVTLSLFQGDKAREQAIFYLMSRGMTEEDARALIVGGFAEPIAKELPLEYAVEMNNLIHLEMKGSIG